MNEYSKEAFEQFVIDELGGDALAGGSISIYDAAKKGWIAALKWKLNAAYSGEIPFIYSGSE